VQTGRIVGQAHRLAPPIVHRDLKPANILVRRNTGGKFDVLVGDFGIGGMVAQRAIDSARPGTTSRGELLTSALRGSHTPLYASPQQVHGDPPDPRDDVHALGVIWYQLLTGDLSTGAPTGIDWVDEMKNAGMDEGSCGCSAAWPRKRRNVRPMPRSWRRG
jgi:serine/threonine protein kinase